MSDENTQETQISEFQKQELVRAIQDAFPDEKWIEKLLIRLGIDASGAERLTESIHVLHEIRPFLAKKVKELSDLPLYAEQVVNSQFHYLSGYRKARPINEQIEILERYDWGREVVFPLNPLQQQLLTNPAPEGSEGYFAVVTDSTMFECSQSDHQVDQSEPVIRVLVALHKHYKHIATKQDDSELKSSSYRRSHASAMKLKQLWELQGKPSGIMLIPAQLGASHAGKSVLRARVVMRGSEFPLDAYEVLQMVLTHENRIRNYQDLWINLPGGEFRPKATLEFDHSMYIGYSSGAIFFGNYTSDDPASFCGSASGYLPMS